MRTPSPLLLSVLLVACTGDDASLPDAAPALDAPVVLDSGHTVDAGVDATPAAPCTCLALGVDYATGVGTASTVSLPSLTVTQGVLSMAAVSGDPVVRLLDGKLFIVNRFGADNVTIVDPVTFTVTAQVSTGGGSNPQDVAVLGDELFVVALSLPYLLVYDLTDLTAPPTTIGLPVAMPLDADGTPEAASIAIVGGRAYVTMQHLESFVPAGPGSVTVIDLATHTVERTFSLANANPTSLLRGRAAELLVATVPDYSPTAGCVERVRLGGMAGSDGCLVDAAELGGYVSAIAPGDDGHVYVAASASFSEGQIVKVSDTGEIVTARLSGAGQNPTDLAYCASQHMLVSNDGNGGGLRVFDLDDGVELTAAPLNIGLPPTFASGIVCY